MSKIDPIEDMKVVKSLVRKLHVQTACIAILAGIGVGLAKAQAPGWQVSLVAGAFFVYLYDLHHIATGAVKMHGDVMVSLAKYLMKCSPKDES